jgi:hypothetical protein
VHDRNVVVATSGSLERTVNPENWAEKNIAVLIVDSVFDSAFDRGRLIFHTQNIWICYDFKER